MSATGSQAQYGQLQPYEPPPWASNLKVVPKTRIPVSWSALMRVRPAPSLRCMQSISRSATPAFTLLIINTSPQLCMAPTPVHRWRLPGLPGPFSVWVKRDDLTGSTLSGNKARPCHVLQAVHCNSVHAGRIYTVSLQLQFCCVSIFCRHARLSFC